MDENNKPYDGEIPFVPDDISKSQEQKATGADDSENKAVESESLDAADTSNESEWQQPIGYRPVQSTQTQSEQAQPEQTQPEQTQPEQARPDQIQSDQTQFGQPQQNSWQAPPQQNGWQAPPQQNNWQAPPQQNGWQAPPPQNNWQAPPQQNNWQAPQQQPAAQPQQTQWSFHDYGPVGPRIPNNTNKPKDEKKPKEKTGNTGFKVLAIIMSALFILSVAGFSGYLIWGETQAPPMSDTASSGAGSALSSDSPSMNIADTPQKPQVDTNGDGSLSGKEIYAKVSPSVVGIAVYTRGMGQVLQSQGSGIIITSDGYLVTNCHVVSEEAIGQQVVKIEVILLNGDTYEAQNVGEDAKTDLAVLKITGEDFPAAEFGNSSQLNIGDRVYVIGNPNGIKFSGSMTQGIVSSLSRSIYLSDLDTEIEYIQTDSAINSGNSGGAFINEYGQVVGISAAKMRTEAGYEGMGFAIPIDNAKDVVNSLIENGYVANRPMIGINYVAMSETLAQLNGLPMGLRVHSVQEDSDALAKGVKPGDIITKMDGKEVYDSSTISAALKNKKPGDTLVLTVFKVDESGKGATVEIPVILMEQKPAKVSSTPEE